MKKTTLRVTRWLGDIPVEAQCTFCPTVSFREQGASGRPNREEYQKSLKAQFDITTRLCIPKHQGSTGRIHPNSEGCSGTEDLPRGLLPDPGLCPNMRTEVESIKSGTSTRGSESRSSV